MIYFNLVIMLILILIAAEVFSNALEHLGERLKLSEGVTGSIFAAVGTAMPETLIPLIAILGYQSTHGSAHEIGMGGILGAPLMLSTLAFFILSLSVLKKRGFEGQIKAEKSGMLRDLDFFLMAYFIAALAMFVPHHNQTIRIVFGFSMVMIYFIYLLRTIQASSGMVSLGHVTKADNSLLISKIGLPVNLFFILLQVAIGLTIEIMAAKGFIYCIDQVSQIFGLSVLVFSVLIIPIATELPEKVNSVIWIRRNKDTLAVGNLTGAMVFQGTLLPAIGVILTPWEFRREIWIVIFITLLAALWLRFLVAKRELKIWHLFLNGSMYFIYIFVMLK
ncbi:MAG: sodium:calcium antiporter [Nitrosomonadales bacterium]